MAAAVEVAAVVMLLLLSGEMGGWRSSEVAVFWIGVWSYCQSSSCVWR